MRPGLYFVRYHGLGDQDESKGKGGGYYPIKNGTMKIGLSKNDVTQHWTQYYPRYGEENVEWRVVFEHADYEVCKRVEKHVHRKLQAFKVKREGNSGRHTTKEWMFGVTETELLNTLNEGIELYAAG